MRPTCRKESRHVWTCRSRTRCHHASWKACRRHRRSRRQRLGICGVANFSEFLEADGSEAKGAYAADERITVAAEEAQEIIRERRLTLRGPCLVPCLWPFSSVSRLTSGASRLPIPRVA